MFFCIERMEFVGHDVCTDGNKPAQSKHSLLKTWPPFKVARDIHSFLGFLNFYSNCIPYFKQHVEPLRDLAKFDLDAEVSDLMAGEHHKARKDMIIAIPSDPCVTRYDFNKRPYLLTDFQRRALDIIFASLLMTLTLSLPRNVRLREASAKF